MRPSPWVGAWIGAAAMAALVAVDYLGWQLLGFSFAPFDLFDALTRVLPGGMVTAGIDSVMAVAGFMNFTSTGAAAKVIEQMMAVGLMVGAGGLLGAAAFAAVRLSDEQASLFGLVLGGACGTSVALTAERLNRLAPGRAAVNVSWLIVGFSLWGLLLGWSRDRLRELAARVTAGSLAARRADRRRFLIGLGGGLAGIASISSLAGGIAGALRKTAEGARWSDSHALPNADAAVSAVPGTRAELTALADHYRVDIDTQAPSLDGSEWRLTIGGLVESPLALSIADLTAYEPMHQFITLSCISNPVGGDLIGTTRWTGVGLQRLLPRLRPTPRATHFKVTSVDGFSEVVALETILSDERVMLAYAWDGVPLPRAHGFPLRLYVPDLYGMKQPKWITSIEAIDRWEPGYWVARGWDRDGVVQSTAVLDAAKRAASIGSTTREPIVSVGGIAYAGARGISRVEVRVGEGEWHEARLRDPLSGTTWVVWRADLLLPSANVVTVRCYDGAGRLQTGPLHTTRVTPDGRIVRLAPLLPEAERR